MFQIHQRAAISAAVVLASVLGGCASDMRTDNMSANGNGNSNMASPEATRTAKLAAWAATSAYPTSKPSDELKSAALIDERQNVIKIVNTSDLALRDVKVWVNGTFVSRVENIPPHAIVSLPRADFFDRTGANLTELNTGATKIQIETADHFYNVPGPVRE